MSNGELSHLESLQLKHKELHKQCEEGYSNYLNDVDLNKLKMEKAHIKAEIQQIEERQNNGLILD